MAKKSVIQTNLNRVKLVEKFAEKRAQLKKAMKNASSAEERFQLMIALDKLPKNSAKVRIRSRCSETGSPRSYYRRFMLSRRSLREYAMLGQIPGLVKSSW